MNSNDRVKICYTVSQDEVPDELSRFFEKTLEINNYFASILKMVDRNIVNSDVYYTLNQIKEARVSLIKMDSALQNASEVLDEYVKQFEKPQEQEKEYNDENSNIVKDEDEHS